MLSYLEIALRATSIASSEESESKSKHGISANRIAKQSQPAPGDVAAEAQFGPHELAPCGSSGCAGCYEVGDGRKIHPPRCGEGFSQWRAWMVGGGIRQ
jgi:hypothetical protein